MAAGDQVTRPGHVQYGDLLLGPGTPYRWRSLDGWEELPALDSGTVNRAGDHGAYPGALYAQARTITLPDVIVRAPRESIGATLRRLTAATAPVDDEQPLTVWLDERGPLLTHARVTRRMVPVGKGYTRGLILGAALEFEASDPRRYSLDEQTATASLPVPESGLDWHTDTAESLAWPLTFGTPGSTGGMTLTNDGDEHTHPVVEFRGPVTVPRLLNLTSGDSLEYDLALSAGDVLVVDTAAGTVTLNGTASRLYTATAPSTPEQAFTIPPGTTSLAYRADLAQSDPAATAVVRYRAAYW